MTLTNNSVLVTPGSGATLATNSPGSGTTEYHVAIPATAAGHLAESVPTYTVQLPQIDGAANRYHWELFNGATSGLTLTVRYVAGASSSDTITTNNLANRFDLFRTTALSSGGTAFTTESSSTASANFCRWDTNDSALPSTVTLKTVVTSITTGAWLCPRFVTAALGVASRWDVTMADRLNWLAGEATDDPGVEWLSSKPFVLRPGQGLAIRQGTVVSARSFVWLLEFEAV
jgi:hypothetical protein